MIALITAGILVMAGFAFSVSLLLLASTSALYVTHVIEEEVFPVDWNRVNH